MTCLWGQVQSDILEFLLLYQPFYQRLYVFYFQSSPLGELASSPLHTDKECSLAKRGAARATQSLGGLSCAPWGSASRSCVCFAEGMTCLSAGRPLFHVCMNASIYSTLLCWRRFCSRPQNTPSRADRGISRLPGLWGELHDRGRSEGSDRMKTWHITQRRCQVFLETGPPDGTQVKPRAGKRGCVAGEGNGSFKKE